MSESTTIKRPILVTCTLAALAAIAGCGEPPPPPSIAELLADPVLLNATMVRCLEQHERTNYAPECINARDAAGQLAVAAERARQAELEAQSERKRQARRRAQEAADAARQQALALEKERAAAAYLGLLPAAEAESSVAEPAYIIVDGQTPGVQPESAPTGDGPMPQVTVREIDLGTIVPESRPEPEPEAE